MFRSSLLRCVRPCYSLSLGLVLLATAAPEVDGLQDGESKSPRPGNDEAAAVKPSALGSENGVVEVVENGPAGADAGIPGNPTPDPANPPRWWSFMGELDPALPEPEVVPVDAGAGMGLLPGDPDAFDSLWEPVGPIGLGGSSRTVRNFDDDILQGELLGGGLLSPLDRQGFRFGIGVQTIYDSNIYAEDEDEDSDISLVVSPSVEYRSAPAGVPGQVMLRYTPFIRLYLDETDLNTVDHSASGTVSFDGPRGSFTVSADYGRFQNVNQYDGGLRETESGSLRASASYQLASRTSLEGSFSARTTTDDGVDGSQGGGGGSNDQDSLQFQVAAYWQATAKTRFGPSVRYSKSDSDSIGDRDALAFLVVADYVPRDELSFYGSLGVERTGGDADFDEDDTSMTGSFGFDYRPIDRIVLGADLSYQAIPAGSSRVSRSGGGKQSFTGGVSLGYTPNPDWAFGLDYSADAFPSVDSANYSIGEQSVGGTVTRQLPEGSLGLSGRLGFSDYERTGTATASRDRQDFRSLSLRYQRPMFAERGSFHSAVQWSDNSGDRDWDRWLLTLGMDLQF